MRPLSDCSLYTFVDLGYTHGRPVADVARQLCDGGSDIIQLRAKQSSATDVQRMVEEILPITQAANVGLVVNDHALVAVATGAECVHLGQEDFFDAGLGHVSEVANGHSTLKVGLSSHAPEQAIRAVKAGADYIAIGPVYRTATKPGAAPVTLEYVRWAAKNISIPWFAIGGITLENLDSVLEAGARRICVVSAILNRRDVTQACQEFKKRLASLPPGLA